jgi:hypothetical protein
MATAKNNTTQKTMFFHFCSNIEKSWWQPNWMYSEINSKDFAAVLIWLGLEKCTMKEADYQVITGEEMKNGCYLPGGHKTTYLKSI